MNTRFTFMRQHRANWANRTDGLSVDSVIKHALKIYVLFMLHLYNIEVMDDIVPFSFFRRLSGEHSFRSDSVFCLPLSETTLTDSCLFNPAEPCYLFCGGNFCSLLLSERVFFIWPLRRSRWLPLVECQFIKSLISNGCPRPREGIRTSPLSASQTTLLKAPEFPIIFFDLLDNYVTGCRRDYTTTFCTECNEMVSGEIVSDCKDDFY